LAVLCGASGGKNWAGAVVTKDVPAGRIVMRVPAVVLHDSFGLSGWRKFLPYQFHKTIFFVAARPEIELFEQVIDTYHPDIIIEEQVQRMILHKDQPSSKTWTEAFKNP
jgi:hypothetical protein